MGKKNQFLLLDRYPGGWSGIQHGVCRVIGLHMKNWGEGHWGWARPSWEIRGCASLEGSGWWRRSWNSPRWFSYSTVNCRPRVCGSLGSMEGPVWNHVEFSSHTACPVSSDSFHHSLFCCRSCRLTQFCQTGPGYKLPANCHFSPLWFAGVVGSYIFNLTWKTVQRGTVLCDMKVLWISKFLIIFFPYIMRMSPLD